MCVVVVLFAREKFHTFPCVTRAFGQFMRGRVAPLDLKPDCPCQASEASKHYYRIPNSYPF